MKIKGFPNGHGSGYWRMIHPAKYLNKLGHQYTTAPTQRIDLEGWSKYDIIFPQGIVDLNVLVTLIQLKQRGVKIVSDFDDMMVVGPDNPHHKEHEVLDAVNILTSFAKHCDLITTTNEFLAEQLKELNPNVKIVPNYIDLDFWKLPIQKNTDGKVRICYVGSITHLKDVEMVAPALKEVLTKYKDKVELFMVGDLRWKELFEGFDNVECMIGIPFDSYAQRLNGLGMDIGIAPLRDNEFNWSKSHIKWFENSIAGGVTVASPTVYSRVIRHGENGFLAKDLDEWVKYLSLLIEDEPLRQSVHSRAHNEVVKNYSLSSHICEWEKVYKDILNK